MSRSHANEHRVVALIMLAVAVVVSSVDIYIPSMPAMVTYFGTTQEMIQLTVSAGIIGTGIVTLFIGFLSDAYGRKWFMTGLMALFTLSALMASQAKTVEQLIFWRLCQGVGGSAPFVLGFAIIADMYKGVKVAVYFSYITTLITVALVCAPTVGGFISHSYSWQMCFYLLAAGGFIVTVSCLLFLPETVRHKKKIHLPMVLDTYKRIFTSKTFVILTLLASAMISGILGVVSNINFYFINKLGMSMREFGVYQSAIMGMNMTASILSGRTIQSLGLPWTVRMGMGILAFGGFSFFVLTHLFPESPFILCAAISFYAAGVGFTFSSITAVCMNLFPDNSGSASSVISLIRGTMIAMSIPVSGLFYKDHVSEIGVYVCCATFMCLFLYGVVRKNLLQMPDSYQDYSGH